MTFDSSSAILCLSYDRKKRSSSLWNWQRTWASGSHSSASSSSSSSTFIGIALGYVDECCLGYTFINTQQSATKRACDGVCIYFQNIKTLLKNAAVVTLVVTVGIFFAWLIPFSVFAAIFRALELPTIFAVFLAFLPNFTIKYAKSIFWNGPTGVSEFSNYSASTKAIARAIAIATAGNAFSLIGGGDTAAAATKFVDKSVFSFVSTGGGATLAVIADDKLPGLFYKTK